MWEEQSTGPSRYSIIRIPLGSIHTVSRKVRGCILDGLFVDLFTLLHPEMEKKTSHGDKGGEEGV